MKKVFLGMAACAMLCACSSDDIVSIADQGAAYDGEAVYMTVRIKDVNSGTRATAGDYAYGSTEEQKVANAYFYFYDGEGNYMAKGSLGEVSGTAESSSAPATADGNIEWESDTQVAVWGLTKSSLPTQMITVLNKPSGVDLTQKSLETALATLAGTPYADGSGNFVMSNSVYFDGGTSTIVNTTALDEKNFAPEPVDLEGHYGEEGSYTAVDVYVERLAAKVGVNVSSIGELTADNDGNYNVEVTADMFKDWAKEPTAGDGTYVIQLQGFDVDAVARDAKLVKDISPFANNWVNSAGFSNWNVASDYRCFWGASTAYGDEEVYYPASNWKGNDADAEETDPLNEYLRYVDLLEPAKLGKEYVYCGENTNTADVIKADNDSSMNCLTQVLMKAQFGLVDTEGSLTPVDIVKYHGEYLTLADFEKDMIEEVERYDFSGMVDDVTEALENSSLGSNPLTSGYLHALCDAVEPYVYCKKVKDANGDKVTDGTYEQFDSRFLQLYSQGDGRVSIWFDTKTSEDTEHNSNFNHSDDYNNKEDGTIRWIPEWYQQTTLVKEASESMDDYDFYIKLNSDEVEETLSSVKNLLEILGFITVDESGLREENDGTSYFVPLGENFKIDVYNDNGEDVNHSYTARNFLIRCIEREAAGIVDDWSTSGFPYLYNSGLMYYNVPIEHLASQAANGGTVYPDATGVVEAQYGVVRNHWYDITVTSVENFGHAIADPDEVIVPQVEEDYYYLGADINILSWKMVNQTVGF